MAEPIPWVQAWQQALYAAGHGFYVAAGGPAAHFTTATQGRTGAALAAALLALWQREQGTHAAPTTVVDVGAGRGELLTHLHDLLPETRLVGVDVVDRPTDLHPAIDWLRSPGGPHLPTPDSGLADLTDALVIAHEWLDVVPCPIAIAIATNTDAEHRDGDEIEGGDRDGTRLRTVLVDPDTGQEHLGPLVTGPERAWVQQHWPDPAPDTRVEIGLTRDAAFADLVSRVRSGLVVAVDYGHEVTARPGGGTLTAFAHGREVDPVPDGSCDLTAHVAMDSLGAQQLHTQRDLLRGLGVLGRTPPVTDAATDPIGYLRALEQASAESDLIRPGGFGDFRWAISRITRRRQAPHDVAGRDVEAPRQAQGSCSVGDVR